MSSKHRTCWKYLLCLLSGALLAFAFAPFHFGWLAYLCPMALAYAWQDGTPSKNLFTGLLFGIGFFGVGVSWVYIPIAVYGNTDWWVAALATTGFVLILSAFLAISGWVYGRFFNSLSPTLALLTAFPALWVLFEWVRSWLFTGFPWLLIGYSQEALPLKGFAPIGSVYLVGFVSVWIASALFLFLTNFKTSKRYWWLIVAIILFFICGSLSSKINYTKVAGKPITVALVQGNIPQSIKWQPGELTSTMATYWRLTQPILQPGRLVFWPESALPVLKQDIPSFLSLLNKEANLKESALLVGIPIAIHQKYYNGAIVLGQGQGQYLKRHLVPFGEYVPLRHILGGFLSLLHVPMSEFSEGPSKQPLLKMQRLSVALYICYEIAFATEVRNTLENASLIANISDDSWFGHSFGPAQQEQIARMRALETGRYVVSATNNGITSIINPKGRVIKRIAAFTRGVLVGKVIPMKGNTPWLLWGMWPFDVLILLMLVLPLWLRRSRR